MSSASDGQVKRYRWHHDGMWCFEPDEVRTTAQWVSATDYDAIEYALCEAEAKNVTLTRETADLRREVERTRTQSERFEWCQSNPHKAQAIFWNYVSRKDRAAAIDAALAPSRKGEQT